MLAYAPYLILPWFFVVFFDDEFLEKTPITTLKEDDIHMAVDLLRGAYDDQYDTALLVSGDGDFVPAVLAAQEKGKEIINVSFKKSASTNLKRHSNHTLTLDEAYLEQFFDD